MRHLMWLVVFIVLLCGELVLTRWIGGPTLMKEAAMASAMLAWITTLGIRHLTKS